MEIPVMMKMMVMIMLLKVIIMMVVIIMIRIRIMTSLFTINSIEHLDGTYVVSRDIFSL